MFIAFKLETVTRRRNLGASEMYTDRFDSYFSVALKINTQDVNHHYNHPHFAQGKIRKFEQRLIYANVYSSRLYNNIHTYPFSTYMSAC